MARVSSRGGQTPQGTLLDEKTPQPALQESPEPAAQALALVEEPGRDPQPVVSSSLRSPTEILLSAIERPGLDMGMLEKLMELQKRWTDEEARKAFIRAMTAFKRNPPKITKNKEANVEKNGVLLYTYNYATLATINDAVIPALAENGFSHSWKVDQANGQMTVTCTLTHEQGYSLEVTMTSGYDDSGGKNKIQAIASAKSYLERYTLLAITGLSTNDTEDDDGRAAGVKSADEEAGLKPVSDLQVKEIEERIQKLRDPKAETALLLYLKVDSLKDIPVQAYELTLDLIERRRRKNES